MLLTLPRNPKISKATQKAKLTKHIMYVVVRYYQESKMYLTEGKAIARKIDDALFYAEHSDATKRAITEAFNLNISGIRFQYEVIPVKVTAVSVVELAA